MDAALIERMARLRGIGEAYHDYRGELRHFSLETKTGILRAMGCAVDDPGQLEQQIEELHVARELALLPPIVACRGGRIETEISVPAEACDAGLSWRILLESGERRAGSLAVGECPELWRGQVGGAWVSRRRFALIDELPAGYHDLEIVIGAGGAAARSLAVVSPPSCYEPAEVVAGRRLWGLAVQLYTVRSAINWGVGDFEDLAALIRWVAPHGAGFIGLNPLHALAPADAARASPYSASNRQFLNVLYIAVPAAAEYATCEAARERVAAAQFQARLRELRALPQVDYAGVAGVKFEIFELLHREFCERHVARRSERAAAFDAFVAQGGRALHGHALFDALDAHCRAAHGTESGWLCWPAEYRDPDAAAVRDFAERQADRVHFFMYLQWLAHEQLVRAQALARELDMPIGLYGDYAVGAHPSGSETWLDQSSYRMGAEIGAPPDPLALKGQGWGIPPPDPVAMQERRLSGFIELIRGNMRYYGALRLDHVMSLHRLWWVPAGRSPADGAYVHYPFQALLAVLALESSRSACLVVGEDLGTVPDDLRRAMPEFGLYHYKVLWFEKIDGRFRRPDEFAPRALATVTTHDLPTVRSYWEGRDIELRRALRLYPTADIEAHVVAERVHDRASLRAALQAEGLDAADPAAAAEPFTPGLVQALHLYLARSASILAALQIEDLLGMADPVNVPGTDREYPNWGRKLTADLQDLAARTDLDASFAAIARARTGAR